MEPGLDNRLIGFGIAVASLAALIVVGTAAGIGFALLTREHEAPGSTMAAAMEPGVSLGVVGGLQGAT